MKQAKNQKPQKLVMRRETVAVLTSRQLVVVYGGDGGDIEDGGGVSFQHDPAAQGGESPGAC